MPRKGSQRSSKGRAAAALFRRVAAVVQHLLERLFEARHEADPGGSSEDAQGVAPLCYDVEGKGGCGLFALAVGTDQRLVPHAVTAPFESSDLRAEIHEVSAEERFLEKWMRKQERIAHLDRTACFGSKMIVKSLESRRQITEVGYAILTKYPDSNFALNLRREKFLREDPHNDPPSMVSRRESHH